MRRMENHHLTHIPLFLSTTNAEVSLFLRSQAHGNGSHPAFSASPLTAKLTADTVDNSGFPWMMVETRLASGGAGRHRWMAGDE